MRLDLINEIIKVTDEDAVTMTRRLARRKGYWQEYPRESATWAALEVARRAENKGKLIVVVLPDTG